MKARTIAVALSLLALSPTFAQDKPKEPAAPAMGGPEMEAMMKAMSPSENHKHLAWYAGDWTFTNRMWMDPSQPPAESSGTMKGEMILDGRFAQTHWKGNMMGMPFEGRGTDGYDNLSKQYVGSWTDNMSTGILYMTGTCENGGKKCDMKGNMIDPMTGKPSYLRNVTTWTDQNNFKIEMFGPGADGKEFKAMEMVVKRKG
jgi:hypothetical protein